MKFIHHTQALHTYLSHPAVQRYLALTALTLIIVIASYTDCWAVTDELKVPVEKGEDGARNLIRLGLTGALGFAGIRSAYSGNATGGVLGLASAFGTWIALGWLKDTHALTI